MFHYGVDLADVIAGRGPSPILVMALIKRLPDSSLTFALMSGGRDHFGFGRTEHMLADIYDAINQGTRATGQWKGKAPDIPLYPRPGEKSKNAGDEFKKPKSKLQQLYNKLSRR